MCGSVLWGWWCVFCVWVTFHNVEGYIWRCIRFFNMAIVSRLWLEVVYVVCFVEVFMCGKEEYVVCRLQFPCMPKSFSSISHKSSKLG